MEWHGYSSEQVVLKNYFEHHGVKGQRWGVRRYQNADGSLTDKGRQRYANEISLEKAYKNVKKDYRYIQRKKIISQTAALGTGIAGITVSSGSPAGPAAAIGSGTIALSLNKLAQDNAKASTEKYREKYNQLSKQKFSIQEGTKINRVEIGDLDSNPVSRVYALYSKDKFGSKYYDEEWPKRLKAFANDPDTKINKNTYEVKTKIVAPDIETRMKIADEMFKEKKNFYKDMVNTRADMLMRKMTDDYKTKSIKELSKKHPDLKKEIDDYVNKLSEKENKSMLDASNFEVFYQTLPKNDKISTEYIKRLSAKGYGAIFDDNSTLVADTPMIIFDKNVLKKVESKSIA